MGFMEMKPNRHNSDDFANFHLSLSALMEFLDEIVSHLLYQKYRSKIYE